MSLKAAFCTTLDVRNMSEYITTEVRDNARISQYIYRADSIIREALRSLYSIDSGLEDTTPYNNIPQAPFPHPDQNINGNDSASGSLLDVTPSSSAVTELWTVSFDSATTFNVSGSISGSQGSGSTASDFTSTNTNLVIPTGNWSGTFADGDIFYIATYKAQPLIVSISTFLAAGLMLKAVNEGIDDISEKGVDFWNQGMKLLKRLQNPNADDGITLSTASSPTYSQDISPEGIAYHISSLGCDVSRYANNENTPWNDSTNGSGDYYGFFVGPIW